MDYGDGAAPYLPAPYHSTVIFYSFFFFKATPGNSWLTILSFFILGYLADAAPLWGVLGFVLKKWSLFHQGLKTAANRVKVLAGRFRSACPPPDAVSDASAVVIVACSSAMRLLRLSVKQPHEPPGERMWRAAALTGRVEINPERGS
jgi:hypothetical protein